MLNEDKFSRPRPRTNRRGQGRGQTFEAEDEAEAKTMRPRPMPIFHERRSPLIYVYDTNSPVYQCLILIFMSPLRRHIFVCRFCSASCHFFPTPPLVSPKFPHVPLGLGGSPWHGKIGFLGFFGPCSVQRGRTHIVLG